MKNKKSLMVLSVILLIAVVGVTFAYFQSTGTFANVFQTGKYRLVTTEVFESPDNWKLGETIEKTITTNGGQDYWLGTSYGVGVYGNKVVVDLANMKI